VRIVTSSPRNGLTGRRWWPIIAVLYVVPLVCPAQDQIRVQQGEAIKAAVLKLDLKRRPELAVIGRDLLMRRGVLVRMSDEELIIKPPKNAPGLSIRYQEILQLSGRGINLSFIADPDVTSLGTWADVKGIARGCPIAVVLTNGKEMYGSFGGAQDLYINLVGARADAVLSIRKEIVDKVFGVTDGKGGVKEYTGKGMKGGSEVGAPEALVVMPVATGAGALIGLAKQKKRRVIPVYVR
jgi:hypothetical protein